MPYSTNYDLPAKITSHLPEHAQTIFREAFNNSYAKYGESHAFAIAWAAVEKVYEKNAKGQWVKKEK